MADGVVGMVADGSAPGEDALLLREFAHRALNEIAVAAAAVSLAERGGAVNRRGLLVEARARLECSGALLRLLARPVAPRVELGAELVELCRAMRAARADAAGSAVEVDAPALWVDGHVARRLLLVAAELMANAFRHALAGRHGRLQVSLRRVRGRVRVDVRDDGAGVSGGAPTSGTGWGRGIVAELVARAGGTIAVVSSDAGTLARLEAPLGLELEMSRAG